jgi:hypothetical protein
MVPLSLEFVIDTAVTATGSDVVPAGRAEGGV